MRVVTTQKAIYVGQSRSEFLTLTQRVSNIRMTLPESTEILHLVILNPQDSFQGQTKTCAINSGSVVLFQVPNAKMS